MQPATLAVTSTDNQRSAAAIRARLRRANVFAVNLLGGAGSGKTTLIARTLERLGHLRTAAVVSNLSSRRGAHRSSEFLDCVIPIASPTLAAAHVEAALGELDLDGLDVLFIESSSTYSVDLDLGQDVRVGVFSVSGGDDKAEQRPHVVQESDAVVLTKLDLLPYVPFALDAFRSDVRRLNPSAELIEVSSLRCDLMERWVDWLEARRRQTLGRRRPSVVAREPLPEWFFG
jgi:hydrogenase nickel incorporation protein HypB